MMTLRTFTFGFMALGLLVSTVAESVAAHNFSRYQVILDRKPFGDTPAPEVPPPPPPDPAKSFARNIRMSAIVEEDDGSIRVGIVDNQSKLSFFLGVGDIEEGIELISASFEDEEAVLRRGSEMAVITLTSGEIQALTAEQQKARMQPGGQAATSPTSRRPSYAERRRARMERRQQPPPEPKYKGEELQKHLQDYQMEVIRQGLPPLPIPLTDEMDDQLVAEGVLPPVE